MNREKAFSLAFEEQKANLNRKNAEYNRAIETLKAKNGRVEEIERTLTAVGAKIGITILSGDRSELDRMQKLIAALADEKQAILDKNGIKPPEFDCEACNDTGYIDGKICDCIKNRAKAILIEGLSKSLPLSDCRFENFSLKYYPDEDLNGGNPRKRMEGLLKLCRDYVNNFTPRSSESILFMGAAGLRAGIPVDRRLLPARQGDRRDQPRLFRGARYLIFAAARGNARRTSIHESQ